MSPTALAATCECRVALQRIPLGVFHGGAQKIVEIGALCWVWMVNRGHLLGRGSINSHVTLGITLPSIGGPHSELHE
jgi:hypothetical protein